MLSAAGNQSFPMRPLLLLPFFATVAALAAEPPLPQFRAVTLDDKIQIGYGLAIADVDGDTAPDILLADKKQFVWYRNPGKDKAGDLAAWTKHLLAENLTEKDNVCIAAQDIDGDGKAEVAVGAEWNPADTEKSGAVFHLVAPSDRTQPWTPIKFPAVEPTTHRMRWIKLKDRQWGLLVVPLHGRGNKNGEGEPVKVLLYHPPTAGASAAQPEWKSEVVDQSLHMTHNFTRLSVLGHGTLALENGVLLGGREGLVALHRADGKWQRTVPPMAGDPSAGVGEVRIGSLVAGEQFVTTVEPMHGNALAVYVPQKSVSGPPALARRVLTDKLVDGHALACGNLLGGLPGVSASDQIVVGWRGKPGAPGSTVGVAVWAPLDARGEKWRETVIDPDGMACEDLQLADLDGDGKLDIIAAGRATKNVKIYFNQTPP
jgi:hypothetical protein